ncbi:MAG: PTS galactitol transporter subunit IIB [Firmicutes bacterium]|nr:PTS galactitol transporter subunit IIB [Bacillota bacterium]
MIVVCGAGINTSTAARDFIMEELARRKIGDVEIKHVLLGDIERYRGQASVIVPMVNANFDFGVPVVKGMVFLIGRRADKVKAVDEIVQHLST